MARHGPIIFYFLTEKRPSLPNELTAKFFKEKERGWRGGREREKEEKGRPHAEGRSRMDQSTAPSAHAAETSV